MLFVKNYSDVQIGLSTTTTENGTTTVKLEFEDSLMELLTSNIEGIDSSIKKSIGFINKLNKAENSTRYCDLLENGYTTLVFYSTGYKTTLTPTEVEGGIATPISIEQVSEEEFAENKGKKHFPRDMVLIILPDDRGDAKEHFVTFDERNLACPQMVCHINGVKLVLMIIKWPNWSLLKYPAYGYVSKGVYDGQTMDAENDLHGFQLSYETTAKKSVRNIVKEVPITEAYNGMKPAKRPEGDDNHKVINKKPYNGDKKAGEKKPFNKNDRSSRYISDKIKIPSKFVNNGNKGNKNGGKGNNNRNFRKSGQR